MKVITTVAEMEDERARMAGAVGLVPTMGYLHEGHLSLVRRARDECDDVVVSIFVNPTQFGPGEDLGRYPRDTDRDLALLRAVLSPPRPPSGGRGWVMSAIFMPSVAEVYPPGFDDWVELHGTLVDRLEGAARPGHFRGVTTVVARLFRVVRPHRAYFGQKDAQQVRAIRRMTEDLGLPVEIVPMPTVREPDGLAMSSRNVYLSPAERASALVLSRSLRLAREMVMQHAVTSAEAVARAVRDLIAREPGVHIEYVSVSDEETLEEVQVIDRPVLVLLAARVGATRLIDNAVLVPQGMAVPKDLRALISP